MNAAPKVRAIADEAFAAIAEHHQIPAFSSRPEGLTLAEAYCVTPLMRDRFEARGEKITGRKIGFTNREMWKLYGVDSPMWGYTTSRTTCELASISTLNTRDFVEPRIEPEIMFGLKATPLSDMNEAALLGCIEWIALGYEVVQSIYPGWKFAAADTVAANGVHGALLVGARHAVAPRGPAWLRELASFTVELHCEGQPIQRGGGALVLDSPLQALRHLAELTERDLHNPQLGAGEIITTGTLTPAMPIAAGQRWTTTAQGIPLEAISVELI